MSNNKKESHKQSKQVRYCEFVSQIEYIANAYNCSEDEAIDEMRKQIEKCGMFKCYAGILHDNDRDGITDELKKPHVHIALALKYPQTAKTIANALRMEENAIEFIKQKKPYGTRWVVDFGGALCYLTHKNAPEKYQYPDDKVFVSEGFDWIAERNKSLKIQKNSDSNRILEGIKSGEINKSNLTENVTMYFYIQNRKTIEDAMKYRDLMIENQHDRNIVCIYIYGKKGTGKTTLAKEFAKNKGLSFFITGGSNDPLDGYGSEEVLIVDDARPTSFDPEEWLKLLDNNTKTLGKSRYHNKSIDAIYIILTSTIPLHQFFDPYPNEDKKQLFRRIKLYITVEKEEIIFQQYRSDLESYVFIDKRPNQILQKYTNPDLTDDEKKDLLDGFSKTQDEVIENTDNTCHLDSDITASGGNKNE